MKPAAAPSAAGATPPEVLLYLVQVYHYEAEVLVDLFAHLAFGALATWYLLRTAEVMQRADDSRVGLHKKLFGSSRIPVGIIHIMRFGMQDDRVIQGAVIGLAAGAVKDLLNFALLGLRLIKSHYFHYAAGMFVGKTELRTTAGILAGGLADLTFSMILGIVFLHLVLLTGSRRRILKGLIFGVSVWFFIYGGLPAVGVTCFTDTPAVEDLVQFAIHTVYGLILGALVHRIPEEAR